MDFKQLRAFLTVADTGNVTRAAELLHLVQPAVSRQIKLLEEDVGTPLFERERHGMSLTAAGEVLADYARRSILELERARAELSATAANEIGGLVTLGLLPSTVEALSGPLVSALAATYPAIRVRIAMGYAGTLMRWLQLGEVDAALLYGAERSADVQCTPLIEEALWVVGPPSAKLRRDRPMTLAQIAGRPLILPSAPHGIRSLVDHACALSHIELNISAETNALSVQRSLVLAGHGLTILPPIAVADDIRAKILLGAPIARPELKRTIVLATPTNRAIGRHVRCAVEVLLSCTRSAVDAGAWMEGTWIGD
jgi:LysR family transcriptional regulator, nitrogen assimilation regulatory protein